MTHEFESLRPALAYLPPDEIGTIEDAYEFSRSAHEGQFRKSGDYTVALTVRDRYGLKKPVIRVGLGTNLKDIRIRSSSGMKIYEVNTGYRIINDDADEADFQTIKLRQRVLVDVSERSLATTVIGQKIAAPLILAPVGLGLLALLFIVEGNIRWIGLIGVVPIFTALTGWCPAYSLFGMNTTSQKH